MLVLTCACAAGLGLLSFCCKNAQVSLFTPTGPHLTSVGDTVVFVAHVADAPEDDSLSFRFDWGDGVSPWSSFTLATTCTLSHSWVSAGDVAVKAQARNGRGGTSRWSDNLPVTVLPAYPHRITDTIPFASWPSCAVVRPQGDYVYVSQAPLGRVVKIRAADNTVVSSTVVAGAWGMTFLPAGAMLYVACQWGFAVIRCSDDSVVAKVSGGYDGQEIVALPSGDRVYMTVPAVGLVWVIRTSDNAVVDSVHVGGYASALAVSPAGDFVYVTDNYDNTIAAVRTSDNVVTQTGYCGYAPYGLCLNPAGDRAYTAGDDGLVRVLRTSDFTILDSVSLASGILGIGSSRDGHYLYACSFNDDSVTVIRVDDLRPLRRIGMPSGPGAVAMHPSGELVYVVSRSNAVCVLGF
jgi:DNA-binding beta-propeller fold protein YncE